MLKTIRAALIVISLFLNVVILSAVFCLFALLQKIIPSSKAQDFFYDLTEQVYHLWVDNNALILRSSLPTKWDLQFDDNLDRKGWYALIANHRSGVDILALQILLNRKVPHLKFFMKESLKWIPVVGQFCYFFNYPFIKRYTPQQVRKSPNKAKENINNIKKTCKALKLKPTTIINFVEGARFTKEKQQKQKSPYKNLLLPSAGGTSIVLTELQDEISSIIDATIFYEGGKTLVDLLLGKIIKVKVEAKIINIDETWHGDFYTNKMYKKEMMMKLRKIWEEKDAALCS